MVYRRLKPLMNTWVEIACWGESTVVSRAIEEAFERAEALSDLLSFHRPDSALSCLNGSPVGREIDINQDLAAVLRTAQAIHRDTQGLFEPSCAPFLQDKGLLPVHFFQKKLNPLNELGSVKDLTWTGPLSLIKVKPVALDLGGIGKGYVVDEMISILREKGLQSALVNAGGDLRCFGNYPWPISIRNPANKGESLLLGNFQQLAIASSSPEGNFNSALYHPRKHSVVERNENVTVIADSCIRADAYTKPIALMPEITDEWCKLRKLRVLKWPVHLAA